MIPLPLVALKFCRECLGQDGPVYQLNYEDLQMVMGLAREWCESKQCGFVLASVDGVYQASVVKRDNQQILSTAEMTLGGR